MPKITQKLLYDSAGVVVGIATYLVLLCSFVSTELNEIMHLFYEEQGLIKGGEGVRLWTWFLAVAGGGCIYAACYIINSSCASWQKGVLIGVLFGQLLFGSLVLAVWGIVWSPYPLVLSLVWSLLCCWLVHYMKTSDYDDESYGEFEAHYVMGGENEGELGRDDILLVTDTGVFDTSKSLAREGTSRRKRSKSSVKVGKRS